MHTANFLRYLHIFFLLQASLFVVFLAASVALVKHFVEPNDSLVKGFDLVRNGTATNAAFGDSHMVWGFVGKPDFPLLGREGETIRDMELRVRFYFRNKQPGRVILQGDPHTFAQYKLDRAMHGYMEDMGESFWRRFIYHHRGNLGGYWRTVFANGGLDVFGSKQSFEWGWVVRKAQWSAVDSAERLRRASQGIPRHTPVADFRRQEFAESYRRTLSFLKERGAEVCVVTMPVSYEYRLHAGQHKSFAMAIEFFRETAEQKGARYVNFFDLYATPGFGRYFVDADHLNEVGAPRLTERLMTACFVSNDASRLEAASARPFQ